MRRFLGWALLAFVFLVFFVAFPCAIVRQAGMGHLTATVALFVSWLSLSGYALLQSLDLLGDWG